MLELGLMPMVTTLPWSSSYSAREENRDNKCKDGDNDYDDHDDNDHNYYDEYDDDRKGVM